MAASSVSIGGRGIGTAWFHAAGRASTTSPIVDPRTPAANGREIVKHLPNGRLVVIPGAGHAFDLFGSEEIRAILAGFLRR